MSGPPAQTGSVAIRVREYQPQDFDVLCDIDRACYEPAIAYSRREMRAYLNGPGSDCIVVEHGDRIAGFCITARRKRQAYIITIDVLEPFRKRGIGTALLTEVETRLAAHGARVIALDTATDNFAAIAFWQRHGYRKIGVRRAYYPNGRDAFAMIKTLSRE